jgi:hypothetical protein
MFAAPHQVRVQPDARGVKHDQLHLFGIVREAAFNSHGAHVCQCRFAAFRCGHRLHQGGRSGIPGEVVKGSAGQHQQGKIVFDGGRRCGAHRSVAAPHPECTDARQGGCLLHPLGNIVLGCHERYMSEREYFLQGGSSFLGEGPAQRVHRDAQALALRELGRLHPPPGGRRHGRPDRPPLPCHEGCAGPDRGTEQHIRGPVGAGMHSGVCNARCHRSYDGSEHRLHQSGAEGECHRGGGVARRHGRAGGLRVDESEHRQVLWQGPGAGQQGLENEVGHGRRHGLGQQPVDRRAPGAPRDGGSHGGHAEPKLSLVGRGREPPEKGVMVPARKAGDGPH